MTLRGRVVAAALVAVGAMVAVISCGGFSGSDLGGESDASNDVTTEDAGVGTADAGHDAGSVSADAGPPATVTKVSVGITHTCAILGDGRLKCWGGNFHGALGLGVPTSDGGSEGTRGDGRDGGAMGAALPAVDLGTGRRVVDVAVGGDVSVYDTEQGNVRAFTCVVLDDQSVKCWGFNTFGELGRGNQLPVGDGPNQMGDALTPISLGVGVRAQSIVAGVAHACALLTDGHIKCWGFAGFGSVGLGDTVNRGAGAGQMGDALPYVDLGNDAGASALTANGFQTCALLSDGRVKCWGYNTFGELGLGDTLVRGVDGGMGVSLPALDFGAGRAAKSIGSGRDHACAILVDDSLVCWGLNSSGQLGTGDNVIRGDGADGGAGDVSKLAPIPLGMGHKAIKVAGGYQMTCAILEDQTVKCWGFGRHGGLGTDDEVSRGNGPNQMGDSLRAIADISSATDVSVGNTRACAIMNERLKCWGLNVWGELGLGDTAPRGTKPGDMEGLSFVDLGPR